MNKYKSHLLIAGIITIIIGTACIPLSFYRLEKLPDMMGVPRMPLEKDFPDDDGVVLMENHYIGLYYDLHDKPFLKRNNHYVIKVFRNPEKFAVVTLPVYEGGQITNTKARTIKTDGTDIVLDKKDFFKIKGHSSSGVLYDDHTELRFTFPALEAGDIIEYVVESVQNNVVLSQKWNVQHSIPVMRSRYTLDLPMPEKILERMKGRENFWKIFWNDRIYNKEPGDSMRVALGTMNNLLFYYDFVNVPSFKPEPSMPASQIFDKQICVSPKSYVSWQTIGHWYYYTHFKPQYAVSPAIIDKATTLTRDCISDSSKIHALYTFVQSMRYISTQIGNGRLKPDKPDEVLRRGYGDCKNKSILLIALLEAVGIPARPVLIKTADAGYLDSGFPEFVFNHMIVVVDLKDSVRRKMWLDPTAQFCPIGDLPWHCENQMALVLADSGKSEVLSTREPFEDENRTDINIHCTVNDSLSIAEYSVSIGYNGENAFGLKELLNKIDRDKQNEVMKYVIKDEYRNHSVENLVLSGYQTADSLLQISFDLSLPMEFQSGRTSLIPLFPVKAWSVPHGLVADKREYPLSLDYCRSVKQDISVSFNDSLYTIKNLPANISIEDSCYIFKHRMDSSDTGITAGEYFQNAGIIYTPMQYLKLKQDVIAIQSVWDSKIIVEKK